MLRLTASCAGPGTQAQSRRGCPIKSELVQHACEDHQTGSNDTGLCKLILTAGRGTAVNQCTWYI